jgi:hypothetical protein
MKIYKYEYDSIQEMFSEIEDKKVNKELEIIFNKVNASDYNKMLQYLNGKQFIPYNDGNVQKILRIYTTNREDPNRITIHEEEAIQYYCIHNKLIPETFTIENKTTLHQLKMSDLNCRINLKTEEIVDDTISENIMKKSKYFRLIERKSFITKDGIFRFDLSCIRTNDINSNRAGRKGASNFAKSNVHAQPKKYEIEIEILNESITKTNKENIIKKMAMYISHFNFVKTEFRYHLRKEQTEQIMNKYLQVIGIENKKYFWIGPKPITLEHRHLNDKMSPNIFQGYGVTEKADGLRCLLFIDENNDIYAITTNGNIHPLKLKMNKEGLSNSVLDAEYIFRTKDGIRIEKFATFDIYIMNGENVMSLPFKTGTRENDRYSLMKDYVTEDAKKSRVVVRKEFFFTKEPSKVRVAIRTILDKINSGIFEYHTDGIILQPMTLVVGGYHENNILPKLTGKRWDAVFKWKPSQENTIDFLVKFNKKDITKEVYPIDNEVKPIMNCILHVGGFKENICEMMYKNDFNPVKTAVPFLPNSPIIDDSYLMKLPLISEKSIPYTLAGEPIENYTIVECRYDLSKPEGFRWTPLRVRHDKTEEYRSSQRDKRASAMNFIETAESIWKLTHQPITEEMIRTGEGLLTDDEIQAINLEMERYYRQNNNSKKNQILGLQRFHNDVIKKTQLIDRFCNNNDYVLDLSCRKGQDIGKFIEKNIEFLFGVDHNEGYIHNRYHGACSQYIRYRKKYNYRRIALMAFVSTSPTNPINEPDIYTNNIDKKVVQSIFNGVSYPEYSMLESINSYGAEGFNYIQMMFSIQYYMKDKNTLDSVMDNVINHIRPGGVFVFCALNGKKVARLMKDKNIYSQFTTDNELLWQIERDFEGEGEIELEDDETCFGKKINVYIESVKNKLDEYLVNFEYLENYLTEAGFSQEETYDFKDIHRTGNNENDFKMTQAESIYSYLHTYAVYRKNK